MKSLENLNPGNILTNEELCDVFGCGNSGGMRRAKRTNSLVLVSSHVKSIYDDRWDGNILYYTGMGTKGDQSLFFQQNKTLSESKNNGVDIYLFESFKINEYIYLGLVELIDKPFQEEQLDENGNSRKVYIFLLRLITGEHYIDHVSAKIWQEKKEKIAKTLSLAELKLRASKSHSNCTSYQTTMKQFARNENVIEYAKRLAAGVCQLCDKSAPFKDAKGKPYLETHHIHWLVNGGDDTVENTIALCPNCHKRMHILKEEKDITKLLNKIEILLQEHNN